MNISKRFHLIWLTTLTACCTVDAATVTYAGLSYRGRFDSPFYQSIKDGTTYVEDFEDHEVASGDPSPEHSHLDGFVLGD